MPALQSLRPDWPDLPAGVAALTTLRSGGVSRGSYDDGSNGGGGGLNLGVHVGDAIDSVRENRALLQAVLPTLPAGPIAPAWLTQVHGTRVVNAAAVTTAENADASIAVGAGAVCAVLTADCLPVLLCDAMGCVVGAAHAGWRGLLNGVLENTVQAMRAEGADRITAWLGPAIGPQRFEVGPEVRAAFVARDARHDAAFKPLAARPGKYLADIYGLARLALTDAGVDRISGGDFCTVSDAARFYSYRRDGVTGRFASLIWIG